MGATEEFLKGAEDDEKPSHEVIMSTYYIGETLVTQDLWQAVMNENPSKNNGNYPVEKVSWNEVMEFIKTLRNITNRNFSLPSEAQWEYAAKGWVKSRGHIYSGSDNLNEVAWCIDNSNNVTHEVAQKQPNELGIYDMSGNVMEWCYDYYCKSFYNLAIRKDPICEKPSLYRVVRGGGYSDSSRICRLSHREIKMPAERSIGLGFRLVLNM